MYAQTAVLLAVGSITCTPKSNHSTRIPPYRGKFRCAPYVMMYYGITD